MTRKDYVKLAAVLNENRVIVCTDADRVAAGTWDAVVRSIARVLGDDNPRFDYERFYAACKNEKVRA